MGGATGRGQRDKLLHQIENFNKQVGGESGRGGRGLYIGEVKIFGKKFFLENTSPSVLRGQQRSVSLFLYPVFFKVQTRSD